MFLNSLFKSFVIFSVVWYVLRVLLGRYVFILQNIIWFTSHCSTDRIAVLYDVYNIWFSIACILPGCFYSYHYFCIYVFLILIAVTPGRGTFLPTVTFSQIMSDNGTVWKIWKVPRCAACNIYRICYVPTLVFFLWLFLLLFILQTLHFNPFG